MIKKKNTKTKLTPKSRAKFKCPELLNPYLKLLKLVSPETQLLNGLEVFEANKKLFRLSDGSGWVAVDGFLQTLQKTLEDCLTGLPVEFSEYIKQEGFRSAFVFQDKDDFQIILHRRTLMEYDTFRQTREDLCNYARYFTNWRKHGFISGGEGGAYGADGILVELPTPQTAFSLRDTKEGRITQVVPTGLSEALNGVLGERVRSCEICSAIFWADRNDKEACSSSCANTLRVRRSRSLTDEQKEKKKVQREANAMYKRKKKLQREQK